MTHDHDHCCGHDHDHSHDHAHDHAHAPASLHACHHHGSLSEHHAGVDAVCLDHVSYRYGNVEALSDVTLHIEAGCNLGIIGPNGGGKTTLLKIILGQLTGYTGSVHVMGLTPDEVTRRGDVVGYVPQQHHFERRFPVNVRQVITMGLAGKTGLFRKHRREDLERVEELMKLVGVGELATRPIGQLSGGQQQRVFIARALAAGPKVLLMDEPTVGVDLAGQRRFADLIHNLHAQLGLTVVIVSHDLRSIAASCERVACLARTVHYHDSTQGLTAELLQEVFNHDIAPILEATA
ncbi:MAG: ATP-binding cassette domain-containing protein [Planctomycetes bacterium]|nr:ATP-binding cassette domain-containing protein [Planctomycetota bacterium]